MGDVQVKLKVMPEDASGFDEFRDRVEEAVPESADLVSVEEEPVAFGLKALMIVVVVPDAEGGSEAIEQELSEVDGVQSVQVVDMSRLM